MSRATCDAAAAAEIRFVNTTYNNGRAIAFARRNADRVTSLGAFVAPSFAAIQPYSQLRDLDIGALGVEIAKISLLPRSLIKSVVSLQTVRIDWRIFGPLCCLQELQVFYYSSKGGSGIQLDDSFATALPLLRVFDVSPGVRTEALETNAEVVMPHLVELKISHKNCAP